MVLFGQKLLYSDKSGCTWDKVFVFGQSGCILAKVVDFGQKLLYSDKNVVFRHGCFIRAKVVLFGKSG